MNIWIKNCKVLVFAAAVGNTVLAMEKPAELAESQSLTSDFVREGSSTPSACQNLRRPVKHARKVSVDLRGSQDSDSSYELRSGFSVVSTVDTIRGALNYFQIFEEDVSAMDEKMLRKKIAELKKTAINKAYDEKVGCMCNQEHYAQDEPIACLHRNVLCLAWFKAKCFVRFDKKLSLENLEIFSSADNKKLYDEAVAVIKLERE